MNRARLRALGLAAAAALWGTSCGQTSIAGGTNSSETENVLCMVRRGDGSPAARAKVVVYDSATWSARTAAGQAPLSRQFQTDSSGAVWLPRDADGSALMVRDHGEGLFRIFDRTDTQRVWKTQTLRPLSGHLAGRLPASSAVCLVGTPYCAPVGTDGTFGFDSLPPFGFAPRLRDVAASKLHSLDPCRLTPSAGSGRDSLYYAPDSLVLDDFQDGDGLGSLHGWNQTGAWWMFVQNATATPSASDSFPRSIVTDPDRPGNRVLRVTVNTGATSPSRGILGLNLGMGTDGPDSGKAFVDLSTLKSLRFRIQGHGQMYVFLKAKTTMRYGDQQHLYHAVVLDGSWQDILVTPDQFIPFNPSIAAQAGITFSQAANRVGAIGFQFDQSGTYQLDDVRLVGVPALSLVGWGE